MATDLESQLTGIRKSIRALSKRMDKQQELLDAICAFLFEPEEETDDTEESRTPVGSPEPLSMVSF